jgi:hypothetical protein
MKKLAAIFLTVLGLAGYASAQGSQDYISLERGAGQNNGELRIAVTEVANVNSQTIILYGVVHVADQAYYSQVQKDLATYDSVLYEGVKQGATPNKETKGLNSIQKLMGDVLGLTFQKDGINYVDQENFVHADIDIDTLQKKMKGESLNPLEKYVRPETLRNLGPLLEMASGLIKVYMDSNPDLRANLQMQMAQNLTQTDIEAALPPQMRQAIIIDRNQIVMDVLAEQLKDPTKKKIAIFYGAGHMPDLLTRLEAEGFKKTTTRWMTAWKIGDGAAH